MGSFGGGGDTRETTQSSGPPAYALPYLQDIAGEAQRIYQGPAPTYYGGDAVASFTPDQLAAQKSLRTAAGGVGTQVAGYQDAAQAALSAPDVLGSPMAAQISKGISDPLYRNLAEQILPNIRGGASQAGQYGGSRQGIAEGLGIGRTGEVASEAVSRALQGLYTTGVQARSQALQLAPQTANLSSLQASYLDAIGQQQQQQSQAEIDAAIQRHNFEQGLQQNRLIDYANILQGTTFGGESTSTTEGGGSSSGLGSAISAIGGIAKLFA